MAIQSYQNPYDKYQTEYDPFVASLMQQIEDRDRHIKRMKKEKKWKEERKRKF